MAMMEGTVDETAQYIYHHLDEDLEEIVQRPGGSQLVRPSLLPVEEAVKQRSASSVAPSTTTTSVAAAAAAQQPIFILQVMSVKDVSLSRAERYRSMKHAIKPSVNPHRDGNGNNASATIEEEEQAVVGEDDASLAGTTLQAIDEEDERNHAGPLKPSGGCYRCLKLTLTDGYQRIIAVEDVHASSSQQQLGPLLPSGVALGTKLRISGTSVSLAPRGIWRLHAGNTELLGGRLRSLELFWRSEAEAAMAAMTGRPSKQRPREAPQPVVEAANEHDAVVSVPPPAPPPPQPLRTWYTTVVSQPVSPVMPPFYTTAFVTAVVSDMVLKEDRHATAAAGSSGTPLPAYTYSLLVQLTSPEGVEQESQQPTTVAPESLKQESIVVDLGHLWLSQLVGLPADTFRLLSQSTAAHDQQKLAEIVAVIGRTLEDLGLGYFALRRRSGDGMVELAEVPQRYSAAAVSNY